MSITVIQSIPDYSFVGNPMWVMVSGSQNNLSDYKYGYYVDTDLDGTGFVNQSLVLQQSRPSDGYGVYDPRLVLKDFIPHASGNLVLSEVGVNRDPSWLKYRVQAAEYTGSTLVSTIATVKATGFAMLGAVKTNEFPAFNSNDYLTNDTSRKFLTRSPRALNIFSSQHQWLYALQSYTVAKMRITTRDATGGTLGVYDIINAFNSSSDPDHFLRASVGTYQLAAMASGSVIVISGTYPIITPSVKSYTIVLRNSIPSDVTETFTYNIVDGNCKYDNVRLHFMNRLGRFDSFNFPMVSKTKITNERKLYQQPLGQRAGTFYGYTAADRGTTQFFNRSKEQIHCISDWLSNAEASWLEELFNSPAVYMQTDSTTLIAMVVSGSSMEIKKNENGDLINYEFDLDYANANEW